uniref:Peptidase S1 domain-containing protein n=1 Tax=Panagrolaimus sp. PS1159 TaxID=55785 RepID=A0AC35FZ33_9BILA
MAAEKLILFFAVIFLFHQNAFCFNGKRILNGTRTPDGVFEFLPRLKMIVESNGIETVSCSSTIISKRHILTAANCIINNITKQYPNGAMKFTLFKAAGALIDYRPTNEMQKNSNFEPKFYVHPSYNNVKLLTFDVAIIEFPVGTDIGIPPVSLISNFNATEGDYGIAAGYGNWKQNDKNPVKYLRNASVVIHDWKNCTDAGKRAQFLICAGTSDYRTGEGDGGGPLLYERNGKVYQIGVASGGVFNNSFYTPTSLICDWISNVTNKEVKCEKLPKKTKQPMINPVNPQPKPSNEPKKPTKKIPLNINGTTTTLLPGLSNTEALKQSQSSSIGFTFNILLFVFICIFFIA